MSATDPGPLSLPRDRAAALGREAVAICAAGRYQPADGPEVGIADDVADAIAGTVSYAPNAALPRPRARLPVSRTWAEPTSTLTAARALAGTGRRVAALNFASATNPGGGFLTGARAQEESLCRSSALWPCLDGSPMYAHHRRRGGGMYDAWVIYSPDVPVFRGDDGALLAAPFRIDFLTSPAVNAGVVRKHDPDAGPAIRRAMTERVARVLDVAAAHEVDALVLGAWGCGVFGNDPDEIAALFAAGLAERPGVFAEVAFAVLDTRPGTPLLRPFIERFGARDRA